MKFPRFESFGFESTYRIAAKCCKSFAGHEEKDDQNGQWGSNDFGGQGGNWMESVGWLIPTAAWVPNYASSKRFISKVLKSYSEKVCSAYFRNCCNCCNICVCTLTHLLLYIPLIDFFRCRNRPSLGQVHTGFGSADEWHKVAGNSKATGRGKFRLHPQTPDQSVNYWTRIASCQDMKNIWSMKLI